MLSVIGIEDGRPEVIGIPLSGAAPEALTKAPEGAFAYEWSPDGRNVAFITRDPMPREEERQRQDKSFIMRADAPDRPTRLVAADRRLGQPFAMRRLTPPTDYVDALSLVARRPRDRVLGGAAHRLHRPVRRRVYAVALEGRRARRVAGRRRSRRA